MTTEERLTVLERRFRRWQGCTLVLMAVLVGLGVLGAVQPFDWSTTVAPGRNAEFDVVSARMIRVMSMYGTSVVHLACNARGDGVIVLASGGEKPTVLLGADENHRGVLSLIGDDKRTRVFEAGADGAGDGVLRLRRQDGTEAVEISAGRAQSEDGALRITGPEGHPLDKPPAGSKSVG